MGGVATGFEGRSLASEGRLGTRQRDPRDPLRRSRPFLNEENLANSRAFMRRAREDTNPDLRFRSAIRPTRRDLSARAETACSREFPNNPRGTVMGR